MSWRARIILTVLAAIAVAGRAGGGQPTAIKPAQLTDEQVQAAIDAMVNELYSRKHPLRFWEPDKLAPGDNTRQGGGYTAVAVLALLSAGESYQSDRLRDAIDFLANHEMQGTYALCIRAAAWAKMPVKYHKNLQADVQTLLDGFNAQTGGWDYVPDPRAVYSDNSIRQFGALALWEASKRNIRIDRKYWQRLEEAFVHLQVADGGWNYKGDGKSTGSMTAAGLATLFITQDLLHAAEHAKLGARRRIENKPSPIELGLKWMDENFSAMENPNRLIYHYYYLYGVERVGLASGYKFFGGRDWFREGACEIIRRLCAWDEDAGKFNVHSTTAGESRAAAIRVEDLAFGLMFLSRGRVPVAVNKLQFEGGWNNRPRDAANLVSWLEQETESQLSWQIVNINSEPDQWLDASMLYVASHEALPWMKDVDVEAFVLEAREFIRKRNAGELEEQAGAPVRPEIPQIEKMKRYLDLGGMIVAINEGGRRDFAESVERAGLLMYPHYEWSDLPEDHWAYTLQAPVKGRRVPLRGLSNGVRELVVLAPSGDLPATFQLNDARQAAEFEVGANLYLYASEVNRPRPRLSQHAASPRSPSAVASNRATVVRAIHAGNWNPEPLALEVFSDAIAESRGLTIEVVDHALARLNGLPSPPHLVIISGVDAVEMSQAEVDAVKAHVDAGGIVLFETAGGRGNFAEAAELLFAEVFRQPATSVLHSRIIAGEESEPAKFANLMRVEYRPYSLQVFGAAEIAPRLRGITVNGQPRVLFSPEDISHALLDQPRWGISGYSPKSARELMGNIIMHARECARPTPSE